MRSFCLSSFFAGPNVRHSHLLVSAAQRQDHARVGTWIMGASEVLSGLREIRFMHMHASPGRRPDRAVVMHLHRAERRLRMAAQNLNEYFCMEIVLRRSAQ